LALVTLIGLVVVVITEPFVPLGRGVILLGLVVAWFLVVFWRSTADLYGHTRAGAEVLMTVLSRTVAVPAVSAGDSSSARDLSAVHKVLPGLGDPVPFALTPESPGVGKTLGELQLRSQTGAVVLAITRGDESVLLPTGGEQLRSGDLLALAGTTAAIEGARRILGPVQVG
jgi:CPA2 family monovalent cation:H+ antiporter-2